MPASEESIVPLRSTPLQTLEDLGPVPVGLAAALLLLICILFLVGFAKRQRRSGIDPMSLASDHYLIECERLLFSYIAVFALLAAGLLGLFRKNAIRLDPPGDHL